MLTDCFWCFVMDGFHSTVMVDLLLNPVWIRKCHLSVHWHNCMNDRKAATMSEVLLPAILSNGCFWYTHPGLVKGCNSGSSSFITFSALTLLVWQQERHLTCKNWVLRYWCGCLSGARCKWCAYSPADVTATPLSLAAVKSVRLSWKRGR